jgi:cobalt-zinc-cadmium resistance protein CzcA
MVIRYHTNRQDINDLKPYVATRQREQILQELANILYRRARQNIQRQYQSKNRGRNQMRNRDLQSVVTDIQKIVTTEIKLPTDMEYGGQFENLQSAKKPG